MITKDYKQNKKQVLALYDDFVRYCEKAGKEVKENIAEQAKRIEDEVFNLMIVGEANSGKSTFINAYLGKEVLPVDALQCTSAIIKIKRGEEFKLTAKSAAGGYTEVSGEDKIKDFLKNHAAISDKYREIPITTINDEFLIPCQGEVKPKKLESFLEDVEKDKIHKIDARAYKELIRSYINENAASWGKIITEIEITFPLPEEMQGITLIDSPGVLAGGNVGKIAEDYINKANAIIFVKSLFGHAVDSTPFLDFLKRYCADKKKDRLFIVLSGKSTVSGVEYGRLMKEAREVFGQYIMPEKIIGIDSKVQLYLNKCKELGTEEAIQDFFKCQRQDKEEFPPAKTCWYNAKEDGGGVDLFVENMAELSNFDSVNTAIEKFARIANYLDLIDFLENLENEYKRYKEMAEPLLRDAEENVDDPAALEDRIKAKEMEIRDVYIKINEGIDEIRARYTDNMDGESVIVNEAEKIKHGYEEKIANFRKLPEAEIKETTFGEMKAMTMGAIDESQKLRGEIAKRLIAECNKRLIEYTDDPSKIQADAYKPNFTETDFDKIDSEAKEKTSGYDYIERGLTFIKTKEKVPYHHLKDHVRQVADSISRRLNQDIVPKMVDNAVNYVNKCMETYRTQLTEHKEELEGEYQKLREAQKSNDSLRATIEERKENLAEVNKGLVSIESLKGELENYVGQQ